MISDVIVFRTESIASDHLPLLLPLLLCLLLPLPLLLCLLLPLYTLTSLNDRQSDRCAHIHVEPWNGT